MTTAIAPAETYNVEALNQRILDALKLNGRCTANQMAATLNWATSAKMKDRVRDRLAALYAAGVLQRTDTANPAYRLRAGW